ncbi:MAG: IPT/TIG domain-containing protein, partial [Planctomycetota bacterium]|nr:IPT/TIG domain-containing protein [Planctomycetota bacterium]
MLLSMNGQQYAPSGASYTYQPSASVSYISPSTALSEGGTPVTVHGGGFSSASEALGLLTCRIGGAVRRAVWASSSAIVCNATRAAAGEARIEVSNNAREYTSSGVRLRLVSLRVLDVQPWSGPVGGATVVSVLAHGSWPGGLRCRFGEGSASAGWSGGASRLRCLTPPSSGGVSGWVGVQLSSFYGALSSGGSFYYHLPMTASGTAPSIGPERGGTRVVLLGGGFRDAYTLRCAFGSSTAPVLARYVDESQLECVSPVHAPGIAAVLLSMNGQQYAPSGVWYTYVRAAWVSYVSPRSALSEGGTPLTVHGAGFSSASESLGVLTCRIGGATRRAVWSSASALVCNASRAPPGESRVEVSNNAREYTSGGVRVRVVSLRVVDVQPWSGPVLGGTVVSVRAYGVWLGGVRCRIGDGRASGGWSGGASRLRCATPPSGRGASGWVGVELSSFDGALSSGGSFYYHARLVASVAAPSIGPERGGTRVVLLGGGGFR